MKKLSVSSRKLSLTEWLWLAVLLVMFAFNVYMLWTTAHHLVDSDCASDLVLAKHLNETGSLLSTDWYYSTEFRVLNNHLVFAPLFSLFSDWQMVRFVGSVLMELILLASYGFLTKQAGLNRKAFLIGSALLLAPASLKYAAMVLVHSYYIMYISIGFLLAGLLLAVQRAMRMRKTGWMAWYAVCLLLLAFGSALNGFRQVASTHAPLVLLAAIWAHRAYDKKSGREALWTMLWAGAAFVSGLVGLLCNTALHRVFSFSDHTAIKMSITSAERLMFTIGEFLELFGYQEQVLLVSKAGILSVAGVIVALYCSLHSVRAVLRREDSRAIGIKLFESMFACSMCVVVLIFVLTKFNYSANIYFVPFLVWYAPLLAAMATTQPDKEQEAEPLYRCFPSWLTLKRLVAYAMCTICLANGIINLYCYSRPEVYDESYAGENCVHLQAMSDYLMSEDYDLGYTGFWTGNVITEMSDGTLRMIPMQNMDEHEDWTYYNWLTTESLRSEEAKKPFMLLKTEEEADLENSRLKPYLQKAYEADGYSIYDIMDLETFRSLILPDLDHGVKQ